MQRIPRNILELIEDAVEKTEKLIVRLHICKNCQVCYSNRNPHLPAIATEILCLSAESCKASKTTVMMMEKEIWINFPQDIHIEILSWLPAKSLISSFKFVCKAWHDLIHDPDFVKMHLSRGAINGGRSKSLIRKPGDVLYQLHPPFNCDYPPLDLEHLSSSFTATKLDFDFDFDYDFLSTSHSRLVGSCNGLLCLSINYDEDILLLNPSTRKYKASPKQLIQCPSQFTSDNFVTYGFGSIDDNEYKVVRIANFYPLNSEAADRSYQFQIDLYSMSSNSWRRWRGDIPFEEIHDTQFGLFMNGSVHWIGCKVLHGPVWDMIVSFNIREEKFGQLPMPPCADVVAVNDQDGGRPRYPYILDFVSLINVRGCLGSVYFLDCTQMMDIHLEIWVMKEYGIGESWTKEFVIRTSDSEPPRELSGFSIHGLRSMTCSLAGDQIIIEGRLSFEHKFHRRAGKNRKKYGRRVLYDINKKKIDGDVIMEVNDFDLKQDQVDYIETLVSLKSSLQLPLSNNRKRKNCS